MKWKDVSFYQNSFDEQIGELAFSGTSFSENFSTPTPELSTNGLYAKCWIKKNDKTYLLKRSSETFNREVFSEYYASELQEAFFADSIKYDLVKYKNELACKCENFTSEDISFTPLYNLMGKFDSDNIIKVMQETFDKYGYKEIFSKIMVYDALILNEDRHLGNIGFLYNADTLEIIKPAPVFDNNRSLFK